MKWILLSAFLVMSGIANGCVDPTPTPNPSPTPIMDPTPDPSATPIAGKWWSKYRRSGRDWPAGATYWSPEGLNKYESQVSLLDGCGGGSKTGVTDWKALVDVQLDWNRSTNFKTCWDHLKNVQNSLLVHVSVTIPESECNNVKSGKVWQDIIDGKHDADYVRFGAKLASNFKAAGADLDRLILRPNHEMNQSNCFQVFPETRMKYKAAMERTIDKVREGAKFHVKVFHAPARHERLSADYGDWVPSNVDGVSLSFHPAKDVTSDATFKAFLKGDARSYGPDEAVAFARKKKLPIAFLEWSPRFEAQPGCPVADQAMKWTRAYYSSVSDILALDLVHSDATLNPGAYQGSGGDAAKKAWANSVKVYTDLWNGKK